MNYLKLMGYLGAGLLILALTIGVGVKLASKNEGYKAETQNFYSFDYHPLFGCARYDALRKPDKVKQIPPKVEAKKK